MGFDDDYKDLGKKPQPTSNLKIDNKKSMFASLPKKQNPAEFQKQVQETQEQVMEYESEAAQLAVLFQKLLEDKVLPENKSSINIESERDLISKIVDIAIKLNNDGEELEGMGSVGISLMLFKAVLYQKDKINRLEYNLVQAEKKIKNLVDLLSVDNKKVSE